MSKKVMTPEEFKEAMAKLSKIDDDVEGRHRQADGLICEVLTQLGYGAGVKIFNRMTCWYS